MIRRYTGASALGLLLALGVLALSALSASATTGGHFTSDSPSGETKLDMTGATGSTHDVQLAAFGTTIGCHNIEYSLSPLKGQTATTLTVFATFLNCTSGENPLTVRMNGCHFEFTSRPTGHATAHFRCPTGKKAEVESSVGLMKYPPQTPTSGGLVYTTTTDANGKHAVTVDMTVEGIHAECHGLCQFLGTTTTTAKITGSGTVSGTDAVTGSPVNVTAT